jgi:uncharacterized protein YjbJ (UPF0337 family)
LNKIYIKGNWNEVAGKLKKKYGTMTGNEMLFMEGHKKELLGTHQKTLGKMKKEIFNLLEKI